MEEEVITKSEFTRLKTQTFINTNNELNFKSPKMSENKKSFSLEIHENIKFESLSNLNLIHNCNIFKLYNANYLYKQNSDSIDLPVYVLQINFFDPPYDAEEFLENNENKFREYANMNEINKFNLPRIGYDYNINENIIYYIYNKIRNDENKIFDFSKFMKNYAAEKLHKFNMRLYLLQTFYDITNIVKEMHQKDRKISIIHPNLIYINYSQNKLGILDIFLEELVNTFDKSKNYQICNFFGYFDLNLINTLNAPDDKVTDIVILCVLLVYIFALYDDPHKACYENVIYELQRDFFMENVKFTNFLFIKDELIKSFIKKNLKIDYKKIPNIEEFIQNLNCLLSYEYQRSSCYKCNQSLQKIFIEFNNFNYKCGHVICNDCLKIEAHTCEEFISDIIINNNTEKLIEDAERYSSQIENIRQNLSLFADIDNKNIYNYYETAMQNTFNEISEEHLKIERFFKMHDDRFNSILEYVENIISIKFEQDSEEINKFIGEYENKMKTVNYEIEKISREYYYYNQIDEEENLDDNKVSNKFLTIQEKISLLLETTKLEEFSAPVEDKLKQFENFVNHIQDFKNFINYNNNINFSLDKIDQSANHYFDEINIIYNNEFLNSINSSGIEIFKYLETSKFDKNSLIRESSIKNPFHQVISYVNSNENSINFLYDDTSYEEIRKINFPSKNYDGTKNKFNHILKNCRYLNMKTRLVITGGMDPENEEKPTDFCFYLYFYSKLKNERNANIMSKMLFKRDQHIMINIEDYFIICIGGCQTNTCEIYNFNSNKWKQIPSLNKIRYNSSVFVNNQSEIFVFFGVEGNSQIRNKEYNFNYDIEKLNFYSSETWELIKISFDQTITNQNFSLCGIIPSDEEIIILGGIKNYIPQIEYSLNIYKFEFKNLKLSLMKNKLLSQSMSFHHSTFIKMNIKDEKNDPVKPKYVSYTQEKILYAIDVD